jgi:6-phosphogluconolactonase
MSQSSKQLLAISTYTHHNNESRREGIFVYEFDPATGQLEQRTTTQTLANPSFLAISPDSRFLYAVNEVGEYEGQHGGAISAYALDAATGELTFLNAQSTRGTDPCYLSLDSTATWAFVANYTGGSIATFPIGNDGKVGEAACFIQHEGHSSVDRGRQEAPHAHSIILDPTGRYALAADLGKDQILVYQFDSTNGQLTPHSTPAIQSAPGAGPRHTGFHPNEQYFYVVNELNSTVSVYVYDSEQGTFTELQTISAILEGAPRISMAAALHITADGRFLYTTNRWENSDSIAVFSIEATSGRLSLVEIVKTGGLTPRNFAFDLTETYLFAENQDSSTVVTFRRDTETGRLTPTGEVTNVPMPVCIKVIAKAGS